MGYNVRLHIVPFERLSEDTYRFSNIEERDNYFRVETYEMFTNITIDFQNNGIMYINLTLNLSINQLEMMKYNYISLENDDNDTNNLYYFVNNIDYISANQFRFRCSLDSVMSFVFDTERVKIYDSIIKRSHLDRFIKNEDNSISFNLEDKRLFVTELGENSKYIYDRIELNSSIVVFYSNSKIGTNNTSLENIAIGDVFTNLYAFIFYTNNDLKNLNELITSPKFGGNIVAITSIPYNFFELDTKEKPVLIENASFFILSITKFRRSIINLQVLPKFNEISKYDNLDIKKEIKNYLNNGRTISFGRPGFKNDEVAQILTNNKLTIDYQNIGGKEVYSLNVPVLENITYNGTQAIVSNIADSSIPFAITATQQLFLSNFNYEKQNLLIPLQRSWEDYTLNALSNIESGAKNLAVGSITKSTSTMMSGARQVSEGLSPLNVINTFISNSRLKKDYSLNIENVEKSANSIKSSSTLIGINLQNNESMFIEFKKPLDVIEKNATDYYNRFGYIMAENGKPLDYINTRYRFNYIQSEIGTITGITNDIKDDIRNRFFNGIRFWSVNEDLGNYSIENYERSVLENDE